MGFCLLVEYVFFSNLTGSRCEYNSLAQCSIYLYVYIPASSACLFILVLFPVVGLPLLNRKMCVFVISRGSAAFSLF